MSKSDDLVEEDGAVSSPAPETPSPSPKKPLSTRDIVAGLAGSKAVGESHEGDLRTYLAHKNVKLRDAENVRRRGGARIRWRQMSSLVHACVLLL